MARALIIGCGCRGRALGGALAESGWQVRGTTRERAAVGQIESAGIEAAIADPAFAGSVLDAIEGIALVYWLLGSARGEDANLRRIHGSSLEALLEKLVDTPVRGFVYEAAGSVPPEVLGVGSNAVRAASERWRIPAELVDVPPDDVEGWLREMLAGGERALQQL